VKIVFATETLSLGINMPARSVVIEDLWKFQGERHELLTPGEYTQLTGRAGRGDRRARPRRGRGTSAGAFERVASLASTRTYELTSSFRPSYNMAVNLVRNYTRDEAHHLLNSSFAQFLADRGVVTLERELERDRSQLAGFRSRCAATSATSPSTGRCARRPRPSETSSARAANGPAASRSARASRRSARAT
jgi:ATP-dependent RNA helicase HelY